MRVATRLQVATSSREPDFVALEVVFSAVLGQRMFSTVNAREEVSPSQYEHLRVCVLELPSSLECWENGVKTSLPMERENVVPWSTPTDQHQHSERVKNSSSSWHGGTTRCKNETVQREPSWTCSLDLDTTPGCEGGKGMYLYNSHQPRILHCTASVTHGIAARLFLVSQPLFWPCRLAAWSLCRCVLAP